MPISIFPPIQPSTNISIKNLPTSGSGNLLVDVNIAGVDLGPGPSEISLPVVLAVDSDVAVRATGQQPMAQSVSVTLASDQSALPINFPATVLAPNAAQEAGGNLSAIALSESYLSQLVDIQRLMLAELRAHNMQLASMTGVTIDPALSDEQVTFQ